LYGLQQKSARWIESARSAMLLTWPLITLAILSLIYLMVTKHYEVAYVYEVTSNSMPVFLKISALWGGQAGSLLFWSWLMAAFAMLVSLRKWDRDAEFLPWVIIVCLVTVAFFLGLSIFSADPFARYWQGPNGDIVTALFRPAGATALASTPLDGSGLNPLLRNPWMIIHPPMLYLGFVAFVIPFAFAIAALVTGRTDDHWIRITRRWTPGCSSRSAWCWACAGLTTCWVGADTGAGTRWRFRR
jgi:cytochrome c-type biogenesis protein CcmF